MTRGTDILIDVSAKRAEKHVRLMSRLTGTVSALVMIAAAIVALILTNVGFHEPLHHAMETPLGFYVGETFVGLTFEQVVNDLFMAFFFLLVGCELKYEMTVGALAKPKQAILPMVAALGGVGVKVFFSTLAIADDMVAIVVIALFYSTDIAALWLVLATLAVVVLIVLNRLHVFKLTPYLLLGAFLWVCFFNAGIHATLAGVVLAFTLPVKSNVNLKAYAHWIAGKSAEFDRTYDSDLRILGQHEVTELTHEVERVSHIVTPPLQRLEHAITFPVNYLILPLFAFVNAQVFVADADMLTVLTSPVTLGVWVGLVLGKPIGILLTTFVMVKFCGFSLPKNATWGHMLGIGMLAGIGFTMAILVGGLAFTDPTYIMNAKVGILLGTFTAAVIGLVYLAFYLKRHEAKGAAPAEVEQAE